MKKNLYPLTLLPFLLLGMAMTLNAQEFTDPIYEPFGLIDEEFTPDQRTIVRLVDIDGDDTLEAFVFIVDADALFSKISYYENNGSNAYPEFDPESHSSFGMIENSSIWPWDFVDIDGDGDYDLSYYAFLFDTPVRILINNGSGTIPDFASSLASNPYGITLPTSILEPTHLLDAVTPVFADLDMDCDLDLMYNGLINQNPNQPDDGYYFSENIGTFYAPEYASPVYNDYGIQFPGGGYHNSKFVDLDCDGDLDLYTILAPDGNLRYYENKPDAAGKAQFNTFPQLWHPVDSVDLRFFPTAGTFWDHGGDGDLDLICGGNAGIFFWENTADDCNYSSPRAKFSYTQNGQDFAFNDESTGNPTDWHWTFFGNEETSTEQNPTYTNGGGDLTVCLEVSNEFTCHGICKEIFVTSTQDRRLDATLILAPNPTDGKLNMSIQSNEILGEFQWQVFDPLGKMDLTHQRVAGTEHSETIDVGHLPPGVYLLEINSEGKSLAQKILKISP